MEIIDKLYDKAVTCTICSDSYKTKKVRSRFVRVKRSDSDFCSYYEDEENSPLLYYVSVCPTCGYSMSEESTSYFPPATREAIRAAISSGWKKREYGAKRSVSLAIETYKLAIYCATIKKERPIVQAGLYMRLVWILRKEGMSEQETRFMRLAVREYVEAYTIDDYQSTQMGQVKLLYLIGDLYKRLGNDKEAILYLSKVVYYKEETIEKRLIELARSSWQEIRALLKENRQDKLKMPSI